MQVFTDMDCHLAMAQLSDAKETWAGLSDHPP